MGQMLDDFAAQDQIKRIIFIRKWISFDIKNRNLFIFHRLMFTGNAPYLVPRFFQHRAQVVRVAPDVQNFEFFPTDFPYFPEYFLVSRFVDEIVVAGGVHGGLPMEELTDASDDGCDGDNDTGPHQQNVLQVGVFIRPHDMSVIRYLIQEEEYDREDEPVYKVCREGNREQIDAGNQHDECCKNNLSKKENIKISAFMKMFIQASRYAEEF